MSEFAMREVEIGELVVAGQDFVTFPAQEPVYRVPARWIIIQGLADATPDDDQPETQHRLSTPTSPYEPRRHQSDPRSQLWRPRQPVLGPGQPLIPT